MTSLFVQWGSRFAFTLCSSGPVLFCALLLEVSFAVGKLLPCAMHFFSASVTSSATITMLSLRVGVLVATEVIGTNFWYFGNCILAGMSSVASNRNVASEGHVIVG